MHPSPKPPAKPEVAPEATIRGQALRLRERIAHLEALTFVRRTRRHDGRHLHGAMEEPCQAALRPAATHSDCAGKTDNEQLQRSSPKLGSIPVTVKLLTPPGSVRRKFKRSPPSSCSVFEPTRSDE